MYATPSAIRHQVLAKLIPVFSLLIILAGLLIRTSPATGQSGVFAEPYDFANVRTGPSLDYPIVQRINKGTQFLVVARSAKFPWVVLELPTGRGWVFKDLVKITGNLNTLPITEDPIQNVSVPTATLNTAPTVAEITLTAVNTASPDVAPQGLTPMPQITVSPTPAATTGVFIEPKDKLNVRFGPGVDLPRIGEINAGQRYEVTRRHALYPWIEIAFPGVAGGLGWIFVGETFETVQVIGNINTVPITTVTDFGYPTLTPTLPMVVTSIPPWSATGEATTATAGTGLFGVSNTMYDLLLANKFEPGRPRQASAFVLDLQTNQSFSLNPNVAFSGTSLIKIPVLVSFFRKQNTTITLNEAQTAADMIVCSENLASNALLRNIGDGNEYRGAEYVTQTMSMLGLNRTFLVGPFFVGAARGAPTATVEPVSAPKTDADQLSADPDPFNQTTPADLGWLLGGIYQCAKDGSGPLMSTFPGEITMNECRQMVRMMRSNRVAALIGGGLPREIPLARKYGWVNETHGDAALVTTPGGDYVLVVMLHNQEWLNYDDSFPLIAELSRLVYNQFNPQTALPQINAESVPTCSLDTIEPSLYQDLASGQLPPIK